MLITERSIPNTHNVAPSRTAAQSTPARSAPRAKLELGTIAAKILKLMSKAGDRQSWLLLGMVLIPVIGMIHNFATYGFER